MEENNNSTQSNAPKQGGFDMNIVLKICGALAVIFLMFLPVAGCKGSSTYNVNGYDLIFKAKEIDVSLLLFVLSIACGIALIFFKKPLIYIILAAGGIVTFLSSYFYVKSKSNMDIMELKIGAYLAIVSYVAVIVIGIIKTTSIVKPITSPQVQPLMATPQPQLSPQQQYEPPPQQPQVSPPKFCTKCGNKFPENFQGKFCTSCGTQMVK